MKKTKIMAALTALCMMTGMLSAMLVMPTTAVAAATSYEMVYFDNDLRTGWWKMAPSNLSTPTIEDGQLKITIPVNIQPITTEEKTEDYFGYFARRRTNSVSVADDTETGKKYVTFDIKAPSVNNNLVISLGTTQNYDGFAFEKLFGTYLTEDDINNYKTVLMPLDVFDDNYIHRYTDTGFTNTTVVDRSKFQDIAFGILKDNTVAADDNYEFYVDNFKIFGIGTPKLTQAADDFGIKFTVEYDTDITKFEIKRNDWEKAEIIDAVSEYYDTDVDLEAQYTYTIKGITSYGAESLVGEYTVGLNETEKAELDAPVVIATSGANGVTLTWDAVEGATSYEVYVDGEVAETVTMDEELTYTHVPAAVNEVHEYTVVALGEDDAKSLASKAANGYKLDDTVINIRPFFFDKNADGAYWNGNDNAYSVKEETDETAASGQKSLKLVQKANAGQQGFFKKSDGKGWDWTDYKEKGYLQFFIKSSVVGTAPFKVQLANLPPVEGDSNPSTDVAKEITITEADKWQLVQMPLSEFGDTAKYWEESTNTNNIPIAFDWKNVLGVKFAPDKNQDEYTFYVDDVTICVPDRAEVVTIDAESVETGTVKATAEVSTSVTGKSALLTVALYDDDNRMVSVNSKTFWTSAHKIVEEEITLEVGTEVPAGYTVKAFLWDQYTFMPLDFDGDSYTF